MAPEERVVATRPARPAFAALAAVAVAAAFGAAVWAYLEYAGSARVSPLALALAAVFFAAAATVLLAFRAALAFPTMTGARPSPTIDPDPVGLGVRSRRSLGALLAGAGSSILAIVLLPLRSLGTSPRRALRATAWRRGVRLVTAEGVALRIADLPPGSYVPVEPETAPGDPNSAAVLVRLRDSGDVRAFSRVCTHAGCTVCVFVPESSLLVCPCHRSAFDAAGGGRVVSGPASQPLPQLPLSIDPDGSLCADGDFDRAIGPLLG